MRDYLLDRYLERTFGPGRPLPRWLRGVLDETFLWVAAGQLLLALGVRAESVRRLSGVHASLDEARAVLGRAGLDLPRLQDLTTHEDLDQLGERFDAFQRGLDGLDVEELERIVPAPQAVGWVAGSAAVLLDLALEVLDRLRARRIRTELVGLDHRALREGVLRLRRVLDRAGLEETAEHGYEAIAHRLDQLETDGALSFEDLVIETRPVTPGLGEVGRLVDVVRSLPRQTLDRLIPLRLLSSRPVMVTAVTKGLHQIREEWVPPEERPEPAEATDVDPVQQRRVAWEEERARHGRAVDERDAHPPVRRAHLIQAGLLRVSSVVLCAWLLRVVFEILLPETSRDLALAGLPASLTALWPVPTVLIAVIAAVTWYASSLITHIDQAEIQDTTLSREPRRISSARRTRARAAGVAGTTVGGLVLSPLLLGLLLSVGDAFHWGVTSLEDLGRPFVAALMVPTAVGAFAGFLGAACGAKLEAARRPQRPGPEPEPASSAF